MVGSLNNMSEKERHTVERFGEAVKSCLGEAVISMSVFGSKVRGDYKEASDIDIIVVVKERSLHVMDQIAEITSDLNIEYGLSLSPVVFSAQEYDMNVAMSSPFLVAVHEEGLRLS